MKKILILNSVCAVAILAVAGCTSAPPSIFRTFDLDSGRSIVTDASQRVIINTKTHPSSRPGRVNPERIVCAEPSPDVATIVANTFGIGLNVLGKGNLAVSSGQASALAQLAERTITVQLLRDQMYRACEAYANGAISGTDYSLLMSRNNDAMVTLMLGESASRLVGRKLAALGATAGTNASASMKDIAEKAKAAVDAQDNAADASDDAAQASETAAAADSAVQNTDNESGDAATENAEENADDASSVADTKKKTAKTKKEKAKTAKDELMAAIANSTAEIELEAGGNPEGFQQLNQYAVEIAEQLTEMHEQYLDQGADEHFISACIVELGKTSKQYSDYNKYGENLDSFDRRREVVFTRKDYTPLQYELIDALIKEIEGLTVRVPKQIANMKGLDGFQKYALAYVYENDKSSLPSLKGLTKMEQSTIDKATALFIDEISAKAGIIEHLDNDQTTEIMAEALKVSVLDESDRLSRFFANDRKRTDRIMRSTFAIEDRERASFLAKICFEKFSDQGFWTSQSEAGRSRNFFDFVEDVETIRNHKPIPPKAAGRQSGEGDSKPKKPDVAKMYEDYLSCNKKTDNTDKEICRIQVVGKYYGSDGSREVTGAGKNPKGAYVIRFARYGTKKLATDGWAAIAGKLGEALKDKKPNIKKVKEGGKDYFALRADSFSSKTKADKFCTDNKAKLAAAPLKAKCIVKKK